MERVVLEGYIINFDGKITFSLILLGHSITNKNFMKLNKKQQEESVVNIHNNFIKTLFIQV